MSFIPWIPTSVFIKTYSVASSQIPHKKHMNFILLLCNLQKQTNIHSKTYETKKITFYTYTVESC